MSRTVLTALFLLVGPRAVLACPVCFGQNDSPMANAMNLGILAMLIVVAGVLASFASFFIVLSRRARMADQASSGPAGSAACRGSDPQEGTAQC